MEFGKYNNLMERLVNLETLMGYLIQWTKYDHETYQTHNLQNGTNQINNKPQDKGPSKQAFPMMITVVEERPAFGCPNSDESIPDIEFQAVDEIEIGDLEVVKVEMEDDEYQNLEQQEDYHFENVNKVMDQILDDSLDREEANNDDGQVDSYDMDFIPYLDDNDKDEDNVGVENENLSTTTGGIMGGPKGKSFRQRIRRSFSCTKCGKSFTAKATLKGHDKTVHLGLKEFSCTHCEKKFSTKTNMVTHIDAVHLRIRNPCPTCQKTFSNKSTARKHFELGFCQVAQFTRVPVDPNLMVIPLTDTCFGKLSY